MKNLKFSPGLVCVFLALHFLIISKLKWSMISTTTKPIKHTSKHAFISKPSHLNKCNFFSGYCTFFLPKIVANKTRQRAFRQTFPSSLCHAEEAFFILELGNAENYADTNIDWRMFWQQHQLQWAKAKYLFDFGFLSLGKKLFSWQLGISEAWSSIPFRLLPLLPQNLKLNPQWPKSNHGVNEIKFLISEVSAASVLIIKPTFLSLCLLVEVLESPCHNWSYQFVTNKMHLWSFAHI